MRAPKHEPCHEGGDTNQHGESIVEQIASLQAHESLGPGHHTELVLALPPGPGRPIVEIRNVAMAGTDWEHVAA